MAESEQSELCTTLACCNAQNRLWLTLPSYRRCWFVEMTPSYISVCKKDDTLVHFFSVCWKDATLSGLSSFDFRWPHFSFFLYSCAEPPLERPVQSPLLLCLFICYMPQRLVMFSTVPQRDKRGCTTTLQTEHGVLSSPTMLQHSRRCVKVGTTQ